MVPTGHRPLQHHPGVTIREKHEIGLAKRYGSVKRALLARAACSLLCPGLQVFYRTQNASNLSYPTHLTTCYKYPLYSHSIAHQAVRTLHLVVIFNYNPPQLVQHQLTRVPNRDKASQMEAQNQEVAALVEKIAGLHAAISKLPSLSPSAEVDALFTDLVTACVPASPVDVAKLGPEAQAMREELIRLCSAAEGHLEAHYADMLAAFDSPLDHLARFPYYGNYVNLSKLEYDLLVRYVPGIAPTRVAFVGSGPLPFSSLVLAAHHLPDAVFDNYDRCGAANERARRLFRGADEGLGARMAFHTADVATLTGELGAYDVVFLAALVGMAAEEKAGVIAHLGAHMADGAALVVRSAHGARGFLYPIVDLEDIRRGGFDVLAVYHPDDEVINSVIVARKADPRRGGGLAGARGAVPVVSPPCKCCKMEAAAGAFQKAEEFAAKRLSV